ncbi:ATP-dependent helicase HepA [Marinobacter daqiaonensis]|uniref:RNA polymerase-associated protein RapA n=1 Tax=Marinobacter daqiaonensis TaxID=650891 RepID=A0A1I6JR19_9GAMM|nr:RNA polymerase-associated protein RapA [Marinobacter daqiaonensis]SFR81415.1 ATP-dependent helicase HepA [Marinobacter daqiaonensis]
METPAFAVGQRWVSHSDAGLGLGIVTDVSGRTVTLGFPAADEERTYASDSAPLSRIAFQMGDEIETFDGQVLTVQAVDEMGGVLVYHAVDETGNLQEISEVRLASQVSFSAPHQRLFAGQFDRNGAFRLRLATLEHQDRLARSTVQGLLGARTQHLPHQLYIAHEVARRFAPRVLLADEVGLGKTIEAGLILHYQLHTGLARRVLIVVPESLIHQWLVEMLRRFNLRFSIVDHSNYQALAESGSDMDLDQDPGNPFEDSQLVLCSLDFLTGHTLAQRDAVAAGWDLMVVDEAHHLGWSPERASREYVTVESLAEETRGLLLLTATPEQAGEESHFARLRLLDPHRFHDLEAFRQQEADYQRVNGVVRDLLDAGEVPTDHRRQVLRDWLGDDLERLEADPDPVRAIVDALLDRHGTGRVLFRNTRASVEGFSGRRLHTYPLPCPELYREQGQITGEDGLTPEQSFTDETWLAEDPRVGWLEKTLKGLKKEKVVVICAHAETAMALEVHLQLRAGIRSAAFHEHLSLIERDRAAAYFAEDEQGAQALICSEIGSEGRNFQFAHHLVLFDLPANPDLLEQRIGRLDRIGQGDVIELHVPWLEGTATEVQLAWFHDGLNAFEKSCAIGVPVQEQVREQWQRAIEGVSGEMAPLVEQTRALASELRQRLEEGRDALIELNSCRRDVAEELIAGIEQEEDDDRVREYVHTACDIFGVDVEEHSTDADILKPSEQRHSGQLELVPDDGITVTWSREKALQREDMAFMSWEHPLVTGVMDSVLGSGLGKAALATMSVKGLQPGTLMLEAVFVVHCPAPEHLQLSRYLPLSPRRLLVDVNGRDLTNVLPHDRLNGMCSNIPRRTAQTVVPRIRAEVETMVDHARALAEPEFEPTRKAALDQVRRMLEPEIRRLEALQRYNPAIREEEVAFFRDQLAAAETAISRAELALEGIRVVITA